MNSQQVFEILKREAIRQFLPLYFLRDLSFHDYNALQAEDAPAMFGWTLRECGTHMLDPRMDRRSLQGYLSHLKDEKAYQLFYIFDGNELFPCSYDEFADLMWTMHSNFQGKCSRCLGEMAEAYELSDTDIYGSRFVYRCDHSKGTVHSKIKAIKAQRGIKKYSLTSIMAVD